MKELSILEIVTKAKKIVNEISQGWDTLKGIRFNEDKVIIVYGYVGMPSTTQAIWTDVSIFNGYETPYIKDDSLVNGHLKQIISIDKDKIYKYLDGKTTEVNSIKDLDWIDVL